ncbi:hypothetical protein AAFF_G00113820 [Aldrovandia affinis]|uniref:Uncharacterized protein n=1 Tax=Aldrovandia affinis TaxID=143900 RepID=A0AAD7RTK0_9TELE|nr:hypothetical protein AAFF_G00113820 [Aldrovandia affinis]
MCTLNRSAALVHQHAPIAALCKWKKTPDEHGPMLTCTAEAEVPLDELLFKPSEYGETVLYLDQLLAHRCAIFLDANIAGNSSKDKHNFTQMVAHT